MKKDVYVCDGCGISATCTVEKLRGLNAPDGCNYTTTDDRKSNWQKTPKTTEIAAAIEAHYKKAHLEGISIPDQPQDHTELAHKVCSQLGVKTEICAQTPNCSICEWNTSEIRFSYDGPDGCLKYSEELFLMCKAQGGKDADECYNSPECKRLFSPVIPPQPEMPENETVKEWEIPK